MTTVNGTVEKYTRMNGDVLAYIDSHLDEALSLDTLSSLANVSKFHFHRLFSVINGENLHHYVKRLRLERAAFRLKFTSDPITDIALESGYQTSSALTKAFSQQFKVNPRKFRQSTNDKPGSIPEFGSFQASKENILNIDVVEISELKVIYVRRTGEYNIAAERAWKDIYSNIYHCHISIPECSKQIGITYDSPVITETNKIRYEACITFDQNDSTFEKNRGVAVKQIQGGKYAVFTYKGDYAQLWLAYNYIYSEWLPATDYALADKPSFSEYRNFTDPEKLIDIYIPIK